MISDQNVKKISEAIFKLNSKFQKETKASKILQENSSGKLDYIGIKRNAVNEIYSGIISQNESIYKNLEHNIGKIVLNPQTTELEILMSEMIRKKIDAKDKVIRELDFILKKNRDADN